MTKVIIADSVRNFGDYIFNSCSSLIDVSLPKHGILGNGMFTACSSLETIVLYKPDYSNPTLKNTFQGCSKLLSVNIPYDSNLAKIDGAFAGCTSLTITVPDEIQVTAGSFGGVKQVYYNGSLDTSNWGAQKIDNY